MRKIYLSVLASLLLLTLTSCMDTVNTTENYQKSMRPEPVDVKRVVTDSFLKERLRLVRVDRRLLDSGLTMIQVTLKSERTGAWDWLWYGEKPYRISYRFMWFDDHGMEVTAGAWIPKDIWPGDLVTLQAVSPNSRCRDFILKMRELNN